LQEAYVKQTLAILVAVAAQATLALNLYAADLPSTSNVLPSPAVSMLRRDCQEYRRANGVESNQVVRARSECGRPGEADDQAGEGNHDHDHHNQGGGNTGGGANGGPGGSSPGN
jgi:hypothetical protein